MKTRYVLVLAAVTALLGFSMVTLYNAYSNTKDKLESVTESLVEAEDRLESRFIYDKYVKDLQYDNATRKAVMSERVREVVRVTDSGITDASLIELQQLSKEVRQRAIELTN